MARVFPLGLGALLLAGCQREEIVAYDAPKDTKAAPPAVASPHGNMAGGLSETMPPRPGLKWKELPSGWTSRGASGMRAANFTIVGADNVQADLAVIPLPGTGGSDLDLVNLWRGQLSLPSIQESDLASHTEQTQVSGQTVQLFSIVGTGSADAAAAGNQILVAALRKEGFTWFFKLGGPAAAVAASRESLKTFLAGIEFTAPEVDPAMASTAPFAAAPMQASGPAPSGSGSPQAKWQVPENWKPQPAPQMVHSKWTVTADPGAAADVTVSVFPGETGGLVANLNRWRSQVGLPPAPEGELTALLNNFEILGGKATLVDFVGSQPENGGPWRIVAAVVRKDGSSWFYKLLGHPSAVESHREAFVKFVQTAQYSRGS